MPKRSIRSRLLQLRRQLSPPEWRTRSLRVQQQLMTLPEFAQARTVALYSAIHNEVATDLLLTRCHAAGQRTVFPRVVGEHLEFVEVCAAGELACGSFGVLEPCGQQLVPANQIDLLLVPGVGFDLRGHRLGYGKGYYDRALHGHSTATLRVGLAFDFQVVAELPAEAHDVQLQLLVTDSALHRFEPAREPGSGVFLQQS